MTGSADEPLRLSARRIDKQYSSPVLRGVDFELRGGEIHALLGANGAGKSTLSKIISGLVPPNAGRMRLDGHDYAPATKREAERAGVQIVQQELNLVSGLTVSENLFLNRLPHRFGCVAYARLEQASEQALRRVGLEEVRPTAAIESLGVGQQQLVEIAAALDRECRVLILDEPTAALTSREIERLFVQLRRLREQGTGIVYISHRLEEIRTIADRATVLRDGQVVATASVADLPVADMVRHMVGESAAESRRHQSFTGAPALQVVNLTRGTAVRNVSFTVRRGERLGIAGLVGSGRTELLRAIFGADRADSGHLLVGEDPRPRRFRHPRQAVAAGLALVTEDRKQDGLLLTKSIRTNISLASLARFGRSWGRLNAARERAEAERMAGQLETRCASVEQPVAELSGGNQQKVVVAKWLLRDADVLLLDEPTRGIDVGARGQLYGLIDALAARGKAILMVSSDLQELMDLCDRILVISAGRTVAEYARADWSQQRIMAAAFAGYVRHPADLHRESA